MFHRCAVLGCSSLLIGTQSHSHCVCALQPTVGDAPQCDSVSHCATAPPVVQWTRGGGDAAAMGRRGITQGSQQWHA